jgi:hypothetical protein
MDLSPSLLNVGAFGFFFLFLLSGLLTMLLLHRGEALPALSRIEKALTLILGSLAVTSLILLLTAQLGIFQIRFWLLSLMLYNLGALAYILRRGVLLRQLLRFETRRQMCGSVWVFLVCVIALFMFGRPSETIDTRDPGGYVNIAAKLADTHALRFEDPDHRNLNQKEREALLLRAPLENIPAPQVVPGFHLVDAESGEEVPRYFPLFSLWLSVMYKLGGFPAVFGFTPALGLLSVLMLIPLSGRVFRSEFVGLVAAMLLSTNMGQIWIVRSPFSEILAQLLLLGGLWLLSVGWPAGHRGLCALAGLTLGVLMFVRVDSVLCLGALAVFFGMIRTRRCWRSQSSTLKPIQWMLAGFSIYLSVHTLIFAVPYAFTVVNSLKASFGDRLWQTATGTVFGVFLLLISSRVWRAFAGRLDSRRSLYWFISASVAILLIYAGFVRPSLSSQDLPITLPFPQTGSIPMLNEISLVRLSWYLSPAGIVLAYFGFLKVLRWVIYEDDALVLPLMLVFMFFAGFYLYKAVAFPDNYWVIRRYVEITIPGFLLLASLAILHFHKFLQHRGFPKLEAVVLTLCLVSAVVAGQLASTYPLVGQREWANSLQQLNSVATSVANDDVVLMETGQFEALFSSPLKYIFRRSAYPLATPTPSVAAFDKVVEEWMAEGKKVSILASEEHTALPTSRFTFRPREYLQFTTKLVEQTYQRIPQSMEELRIPVQVYEVKRKESKEPLSAVSVNFGLNFGFKTSGVYGTEATDDETYRWTGARASIELPKIPATQDAVLMLRVGQDLPPGIDLGPAKVHFNGKLMAEDSFRGKLRMVKYPVPKSLLNVQEINRVELSTPTFNPARLGLSNDTRDLGLMLDSLRLQSLVPISSTNPYQVTLSSEMGDIDGELTGFYLKGGDRYRWTRSVARIILPVPITGDEEMTLKLRAVKSSPDPASLQRLSVVLDGKPLGDAELTGTGDQFRVYDFPIPRGLGNKPLPAIEIRVDPPWTPVTSRVSADWRTLGCAIDWVRIEGCR